MAGAEALEQLRMLSDEALLQMWQQLAADPDARTSPAPGFDLSDPDFVEAVAAEIERRGLTYCVD